MTRVTRYIARQIAVSLLAVTVGLAALIWLTQSLRFIELVLDRGLPFSVFLELTGLLLPSFFAVIIPITTFVVTLFAYVRLSSDRELVVMRAAGLSDWRLARPALLVAVVSTALGLLLQTWLVPVSHAAFREWQFEIRNQMAAILLQEGVFSSVGSSDLTVYARVRERDGTLRGILIHDMREPGAPVTILAERGVILPGANGPRVTLLNGQRQQMERAVPPGSPPGTAPVPRLSVLAFGENSIDLARSGRAEDNRNRDSRERFVGELLNPDPEEGLPERDVRKFRAEGHGRLASPFTALAFALVGLAAALASAFRRHGGGLAALAAIGVVVSLLAVGLAVGNLAARDNRFIPLIWLHAVGPGLVAAWILSGAPGWPRRAPPVPGGRLRPARLRQAPAE